jgi:MFS family permease
LEESIGRSLNSAWRSILTGVGHFLDARKVLRGSISKESRRGLDWLNFFLADIQTGFGAFVAFYLANLGWNKDQVGLALSVGTIAGLIALLPGGAIVDWVPWKRALAAIGIATIAASALILALAPTSGLHRPDSARHHQRHRNAGDHLYGFLILAAAAVAATVLLWTALTETKPGKHID